MQKRPCVVVDKGVELQALGERRETNSARVRGTWLPNARHLQSQGWDTLNRLHNKGYIEDPVFGKSE